jgi:hypothetical protein
MLRAVAETALPLAVDLRSQGKTSCLLLDFSFDGSVGELVTIAEEAASCSLPDPGIESRTFPRRPAP